MTTISQPMIEHGATHRCPHCRGALVFTRRHPIVTVGMILDRTGSKIASRIRYERAWICRNIGCDYRELVELVEEG